MILCFDAGNTMIKCGVYENGKITQQFSVDTDAKRSSNQFGALLKVLIKSDKKADGAIISSVVPDVTMVIKDAVDELYSIDTLILNRSLKTKIKLKLDYPNELGGDLISGAVGAVKKYGFPIVVADFGTATKMYVVDKDGYYIGGMIAPGMGVSMKALINNTRLLYEVPIVAPKKICGSNSKEAIQSGIVFGQAYMVSEFARRMEKELGYELKRVVTGGFSKNVKDSIVCFAYEPSLVLDGLYEIYCLNNRM
jgi:type III pantothenate kinase